KTYLDELKSKSLAVNWMTPDYLLLPSNADCSVHVNQGRRLLFRMKNGKGGAIPVDWVEYAGLAEYDWAVVHVESQDSSEDGLLTQFSAEPQLPVVNLLQGAFRPELKRMPFWQSWYLYGVVLLISSLLLYAGTAFVGFRYQQSTAVFEQAMEQIY